MKAKLLAGVTAVALALMPAALALIPSTADAYFIPDPAEPGEHYGAAGIMPEWTWEPDFKQFGGALKMGVEVEAIKPYFAFGYALPRPLWFGQGSRIQFEWVGAWASGHAFDRQIGAGNVDRIDGSSTTAFASSSDNRLDFDYERNQFGFNLQTDFELYDEWTYTLITGVDYA